MYRQLLVQSTLTVLLPTEDLANTCLRTLVSDIIADLILGQAVAGKMSQGWFIHGTITKIVGIIKARIRPRTATAALSSTDARSRLEMFGLLTSTGDDTAHHSPNSYQSRLSTYFWQILQYAAFVIRLLRLVLVGLSQSRRSRPRPSTMSGSSSPIATTCNTPPSSAPHASLAQASDMSPVILSYRIFPAISTLLRLPVRTPWLASSAALVQHVLLYGPGQIGGPNSMLERYVALFLCFSVCFLFDVVKMLLIPNLCLNNPPTTWEHKTMRTIYHSMGPLHEPAVI